MHFKGQGGRAVTCSLRVLTTSLVLTAACSDAPRRPAAAGTAGAAAYSVVVSGDVRDPVRMTAREIWRVGGPNAALEEQFSGPLTSVYRSPTGDLYALDSQAASISVFTPAGRFVRRIGRPGRGPGELDAPSGLGWDSRGRLWVANAFSGRYTVFDSLGAVLATVPRPIPVIPRLQHPLVHRGDGTLIDEAGRSGGGPLLLRLDTTGTVLDTLPPLPHLSGPTGYLPPGFDDDVLLYIPRLVWAHAPDGTVWFAESGGPRLVRRTLAGDTTLVIELSHRSAALDGEMELRVEREIAKLGTPRSGYSIARPVIQAIHPLPDGRLLVQIVEEPGEESSLFDLFAADGRYVGEVRTPLPLTSRGLAAFAGDTMAAIGQGALDAPWLIRFVLPASR